MLIDAHAHLDKYDEAAIPSVLAQLAEHQILTVGVAMDPESYARTCALAEHSRWIIPASTLPWTATAPASLASLWRT